MGIPSGPRELVGRKGKGSMMVDWEYWYPTVLTSNGSTIPHPHANPSPHPTTLPMARVHFKLLSTFTTLKAMTDQEGVILDSPRNKWLILPPEFQSNQHQSVFLGWFPDKTIWGRESVWRSSSPSILSALQLILNFLFGSFARASLPGYSLSSTTH